MSKEIIVVNGAICKCDFGSVVDKIVVSTNTTDFANDTEGSNKAIATTKEIGATVFEKNCFGPCPRINNYSPPCMVNVTQWTDFYKEVVLKNEGKILTNKSKAICAIAGSPCISIVYHGQIQEPNIINVKNSDNRIQSQLNPLVDINDLK